MKISDPMHLDMINIITKYHLSRIDREGNVVKYAHVKINKIFQNLNFCKMLNHIISTTSDQNLMIYDSFDSSNQDAYNRSVFMSLGSMDRKLFADV